MAGALRDRAREGRSCQGDEGWFSFETAAGRGIGHVRLKDEQCWTLLTALQEL